jgi:hypothetical protein
MLKSVKVIEMSAFVVRAFVQLRKMLPTHKELMAQLEALKRTVSNMTGLCRSYQCHQGTHESTGPQDTIHRIHGRYRQWRELIHCKTQPHRRAQPLRARPISSAFPVTR